MSKLHGVKTVVVGGYEESDQQYCGTVGGQSTDFASIDTEIKVCIYEARLDWLLICLRALDSRTTLSHRQTCQCLRFSVLTSPLTAQQYHEQCSRYNMEAWIRD